MRIALGEHLYVTNFMPSFFNGVPPRLRAVALVDEYDKPILDVLDVNAELEEWHRNALKAFYSVFKGAVPASLPKRVPSVSGPVSDLIFFILEAQRLLDSANYKSAGTVGITQEKLEYRSSSSCLIMRLVNVFSSETGTIGDWECI